MERFVDRYSLGFERGEGSSHFLRVKIPNGKVMVDQFRGLARLSDKYGRGYAEITNRQDLQFHWVDGEDAPNLFNALDELGFTTDKCGQAYPGAGYGDVRGIMGCPVAGVDRFELFDASPLVNRVNDLFTGNRAFLDLPRKFKMSISGCAINCTCPEIQDLSFVAVKRDDGGIGFSLLVGGGVGVPPKLAKPLGVLVEPDTVVAVAESIVGVFRDHGRRDAKVRARFKWLVEEWGVDKLRTVLTEKLGRRLEDHPVDYLPASGGEHVGVERQKQEGLSYINLPLIGGILSSSLMLRLADVAEKYGWPELRLTPSQNLILVGIEDDQIEGVLDRIRALGIDVAGSPLKWTTMPCAGNFCGKAPENVKKRSEEIVKHLEARFGAELEGLALRVYLSGCPNGCARHQVADIGLQGVETQVNKEAIPGYNLYLGGGLGPNPCLGRLVARGVRADGLKYALERIIAAYLKKRTDGESFREFCSRHRDDELRASTGLDV